MIWMYILTTIIYLCIGAGMCAGDSYPDTPRRVIVSMFLWLPMLIGGALYFGTILLMGD